MYLFETLRVFSYRLLLVFSNVCFGGVGLVVVLVFDFKGRLLVVMELIDYIEEVFERY